MKMPITSIQRTVAVHSGAQTPPSAGDPIPSSCQPIEVHVAKLEQLFNAMDPAPFRQRDLDPEAEEFIVGWAREIPADAPLALVVHLDRPAGRPRDIGTPSGAMDVPSVLVSLLNRIAHELS